MPWKMTDEDDDYDGPWPEGDAMTTDEAREFFRFLHGEVPWNGTWFGEYAPGERGAYWWRKILNEAIAALAAPHKTDRWNIDVDDSDGSLLICKGEHDKDEKCETVRYVPASPRPDAPDLYWELHGLSKLLEGRGRIDEGETPDAYSTILDAMALARGPAPAAPESKGVLSMDGKPAAPVSAPARREDMEAFAAELRADPEKAKRFFTQAGIIGVGGKLTPAYGGQAQGEPGEIVPRVWREALRKLTFMARTSGGSGVPDEGLKSACAQAEDLLSRPYNYPPRADFKIVPIGPREPDTTMVICPACTSQFRAIPVEVQEEVARLRAALESMLENFEHGDLNDGEAAALDKARAALRGA